MSKNTYHVSLVRTLEYSDCIEVEAETEDAAIEAWNQNADVVEPIRSQNGAKAPGE